MTYLTSCLNQLGDGRVMITRVKRIYRTDWLPTIALLALLALMSHEQEVHAAEPSFTVGVVPQFEQSKTVTIWQPLLKLLTEATGYEFKLQIEPNIPTFRDKLLNGVYDFAYASPGHFIEAHNELGYLPLIRSGSRRLQGILVMRRESATLDIEDLDNRKVAFPENAFAATELMQGDLLRRYQVEPKAVYVDNHTTGYLYVAKGLALAAGGVQRTFERQRQELKDRLVVVHRTDTTAPHPFIAHPRTARSVVRRIQSTLIELASANPELFEAIPMSEPVIAQAADYSSLSH